MRFFEIFKARKKEDLPLIARVNLAELQKEREENMKLGEKSILAYDYSSHMPRIRLYYVGFNKYNNALNQECIEKVYEITTPFVLPRDMTIDEACKVISYLTEKVEKENGLEPASKEGVAQVGKMLSNYGFSSCESYSRGHFKRLALFEPRTKIESGLLNSDLKQKDGITELYTVGGDTKLFKKSEFYKTYFNWFVDGVTREDVKEIYKRIGKSYLFDNNEEDEKQ